MNIEQILPWLPIVISIVSLSFSWYVLRQQKAHTEKIEKNKFTLDLIREYTNIPANDLKQGLFVDKIVFLSGNKETKFSANYELIRQYILQNKASVYVTQGLNEKVMKDVLTRRKDFLENQFSPKK